MARLIIILMLAGVMVGLLSPILVRLRRGRIPDDVPVRRKRMKYFVPIAAGVAFSLLIGAALWWVAQ